MRTLMQTAELQELHMEKRGHRLVHASAEYIMKRIQKTGYDKDRVKTHAKDCTKKVRSALQVVYRQTE